MKRTLVGLLILSALVGLLIFGLCIQACKSLPFSCIKSGRQTGYHFSELTVAGTDIYFGAGYCLYRLDTQKQALNKIACTKNWTFQRPAVDGKRAYAQVLVSPEVGQFFVSVDLSTGEIVWRVKEAGRNAYFWGTKQNTVLLNDRVITARRTGIDVFDSHSGEQIWRSEHSWMGNIPFLIQDDLIWYIVDTGGENPQDGTLKAVASSTGEVQQTIGGLQSSVPLFSQLLYMDDRWIVGVNSPDYTAQEYIFAIDRARCQHRYNIVPKTPTEKCTT